MFDYIITTVEDTVYNYNRVKPFIIINHINPILHLLIVLISV